MTLLVGDEEARILAHKRVLSSSFPFFEAACKAPETTVVKLPDEPFVIQGIVY
jgi:hypothetical protein